jgi:uncharacterized protein (TIGR00251 family)
LSIEETENGVLLRVYVKPRSAEFKIVVDGDEIVVFCRQQPFQGKANMELVKELARLFHEKVELVSGAASKQKVFLIRDVDKSDVKRLLGNTD